MRAFVFLLLGLFTFQMGSLQSDQIGNDPAETLRNLKEKYKKKRSTRKYSLCITGCARSGTTYIVSVLQKCGYDVKHEAEGKKGVVSWGLAVDSKWTSCGPGTYYFKFNHIFHQVRDPVKTMSSCTTEPAWSWRFICKHIPEIKIDEPLIVRCAKYWYYWNLKAEQKSEWTYRVEDIENALEEMGRRLGVAFDKNVLQKVPKNVNSRKRNIEYTWADLKAALDPELYLNIQQLAKKYGYAVDETI